MFLRVEEEIFINKRWGHEQTRNVDVFQCDECNKEFKHGTQRGMLNFCSKECRKASRSHGKLLQKVKQVNLERHGVEFGGQVIGAAEKMIATRIERFGTSTPIHFNEEISAKFRKTMLENHGAEHPSRAEDVKEKKKQTYLERYGIPNTFVGDSPFRSSNEDYSIFGAKGYRSLEQISQGNSLSKPEKLLLGFLEENYGQVKKQIEIFHDNSKKPWLIDAYVTSIDTYVELDGVFWHGLNKTYDELHPNKRLQYDRDRKKDEWFKNAGLRLIRFTDLQINECSKTGNWACITATLGG